MIPMGRPEWPRSMVISTELQRDHTDGVNNALNHILPLFTQNGTDILLFAPSSTKGLSIPIYPNAKVGILSWGHLNEEFRDIKPDLALALAPALMGLVLLDWAELNNIPRAAAFNTNVPEYTEAYGLGKLKYPAWSYYRYEHKMAQLNLAPSESVADNMKQHGFPNVKVWGRGVDPIFNPKKWNEGFREKVTSSNKDRPIILYVGRLAQEKGLESLESVIQNIPQAQFVFVGDGPIRKKLEKLFAYPNVTFTGFLHGEDLATAYASSDIFLTPSQTEGFSNTVLEAFKSGLPAVMFDESGMRDIQKESNAALLALSGDISAMIKNLLTLLDNQGLRKELSRKALQYAETQTWEQSFGKLWEYLRGLRPSEQNTHYYPVVEIAHKVDELRESIRQGTVWKYEPQSIYESLGTRVAKKALKSAVLDGRLSREEATVQERNHTQFDEQFHHPTILKIDLGGLGVQKVDYIDIQLPDQKGKNDKPPIFFLPARSGDFYGIEPIIRELFLSGRRVISVSYAESFLSETTESFTKAVEQTSDYQTHTFFFKEAIKKLLSEEGIELWGYSAGGTLVGELLTDPDIASRVINAVALSPTSLIEQTRRRLDIGVGKEIWRLIHHLDEFPNISEVIGRKYNPFEDPEKVTKQQKLRKGISNTMLTAIMRKRNPWSNTRVRQGGSIYIVSGKNDQIVKSDQAVPELLDLPNQQIKIVNITNGSHLTPLTKADKYSTLLQKLILDKDTGRFTENSL